MSEAIPVISEEVQATPPKTRALKWIVSVIAIAMSLFHMYVAGFGPPEAMVSRGVFSACRPRGDPARPRVGAADHRSRLSRLHDLPHQREAADPGGADVSL